MCWCDPRVRTPMCGKLNCHPPGKPEAAEEWAKATSLGSGDNRYYIQDTRKNAVVGNCISFWALDNQGYTCNLDKAQKYTLEEAEKICNNRGTDRMWPVQVMDSLAYRHVDIQRLPRNKNIETPPEIVIK